MVSSGLSGFKPKNRHAVRIAAGKIYFTFKRYLFWLFGDIKFAHIHKNMDNNKFDYKHFSHQTPLLRQLKDVEMYLQHNKITNLRIAIPKINGVIINPGETFSYWKLIGKPTKYKGYLKGMVLKNGTFEAGTGGGLCQLSNLIYWMTIHTPLTVVERHRHGFDVFPDADRTQPFGSGATCFYNYVDLMIKNETNQPFQLLLEVTENELKGIWKSTKPPDCKYEVYEKDHLIQSAYGGYTRHNRIFRKKYALNDLLLADEFIAENHAIMMYAPLLPIQ